MQYTENIDLLKPDQNEQYDIDHANENMDIIDEHIHNLEEGADSLREEMLAGDAAAKQFANMQGVCAVSQGGTGKTTTQDALNALHKDVATVVGDLKPVDEMLFVRRTNENLAENIPESIDVKNVTLEVLASKIFALMEGTGRFTSTKDGLVPKSGNNGAGMFLNAQGNWAEPQGKTEIIPVTASASFDVSLSTIIRIQQNATVLIRNPTQYMANLIVANETARSQLVSIKLQDGSVSYKLNKGRVWRLMWNGSFWIPQFYEPECGAIRETYATVAPDGWFLCNGQDTTGTANELSTCFPNLYALLGNSNVLPDLRECTLVGAGKNIRDLIAVHDEYAVGQFKDDICQNHTHNMQHTHDMNHTHSMQHYHNMVHYHDISHVHSRGTMDITGRLYNDIPGIGVPVFSYADGAFSLDGGEDKGVGSLGGGISTRYHNSVFQASRNWSGYTSSPLNPNDPSQGIASGLDSRGNTDWASTNDTGGASVYTTTGASSYTTTGATGRAGASTHGKQKGVNYMIKA